MSFVVGILTVVYFIVCFLLIIIVLMQEPKGGGLSSAFGGAGLDTAFGASIGRKMSSFTVWVAVIFIVLTVFLAILTKSEGKEEIDTIMEGQQRQGAPVTPEEGVPEEAPGTPESPEGGTQPPPDTPPGTPESPPDQGGNE